MQTYRGEAKLAKDRVLTLVDLPFSAGETVEVLIVAREAATTPAPGRYPLRGTPVQYVDPTMPVAEDDWESGR